MLDIEITIDAILFLGKQHERGWMGRRVFLSEPTAAVLDHAGGLRVYRRVCAAFKNSCVPSQLLSRNGDIMLSYLKVVPLLRRDDSLSGFWELLSHGDLPSRNL